MASFHSKQPKMPDVRDVLTPREIADRTGFSYHAILRAIRRGDLRTFEPVPGHYRIQVAEYERWLEAPVRRRDEEPKQSHDEEPKQANPNPKTRVSNSGADRGTFARLRAIERRN